MKLRGIGNYAGSFDGAKVMIVDKDKNLSKVKITKIPVQRWQNGAAVVLSYKNNKKTGTGLLKIKGKGNYKGQLSIPFHILNKELTSKELTVRIPNVPYTEKANRYQSNPVLTDSDGGVLIKNKDYVIESYHAGNTLLDNRSHPEEGTVITVTIKGKGSYTGIVQGTYIV